MHDVICSPGGDSQCPLLLDLLVYCVNFMQVKVVNLCHTLLVCVHRGWGWGITRRGDIFLGGQIHH